MARCTAQPTAPGRGAITSLDGGAGSCYPRIMKFSHGVWIMREGVSAIYPERVAEHRSAAGILELTCLNRGPEERLNAYALSVRLSSPMPDVIRIQVSHRQGAKRRGPSFVLNDHANALPVAVKETE